MAKRKKEEEEDDEYEGEAPADAEEEEQEEDTGDVDQGEEEPEPEPQTPTADTSKVNKPAGQKVGSIDSLVFLKEYAKDPKRQYASVASKLGIARSSAQAYLSKYIALVNATRNDRDFPRRVRLVPNKNVPDKYHISDDDLVALVPLSEIYGPAASLPPGQNAQTYNQTGPAYSYDNMSYNPNDPFQRNPQGQPQPGMGPNNLPPGYMQKNQEYANLSTFSRSQMMLWVLEKAPFIHYSKIDPLIALFETDERNFMMNPDALYRTMIQYFGKENGDIAFHRFKAVVGNFLPPTQGFGQNPYYPDPNAGQVGQMGQPGSLSYYEAMNVIPYGMNPNSQDAQRLIIEWQRKQREKQERKEQQEEFTEQIKNLMNMKMLEVVDPKGNGNGRGGPGNMEHLVAAGIVRAVQGVDEKGNAVMKYEPIQNPMFAQMAQQQSSNNNQIEWARLFLETMNATLARQSEMPKFAESLLNNFIQKMPMQTDPVEHLINTKKVLDTIAPQMGSSAMNLDVAKYNLAQERLKTDREFAMMAAQREHEKMMYERQRDERMEQASSQNMSEIVKSVFSIGKEAFLPLLMMLTQGRMPGGGMGGMPGMIPPGAGMPPQPQAVAQAPPQPVRSRPRPRPRAYNDMEEQRFAPRHAAPASNDDLGYGRPETVQPQQPQQQVVANNSGTMRQY